MRAQCIDATLGATSALTTATGPVVLSRKNQWGPYATCPPGYQVQHPRLPHNVMKCDHKTRSSASPFNDIVTHVIRRVGPRRRACV